MKNTYQTKDMYIASYLSLFEKLVNVIKNNDVFWFVFSNQEKCQRRVLKYWNGEATVTVRDYVSAIKNIKSRIFFNN